MLYITLHSELGDRYFINWKWSMPHHIIFPPSPNIILSCSNIFLGAKNASFCSDVTYLNIWGKTKIDSPICLMASIIWQVRCPSRTKWTVIIALNFKLPSSLWVLLAWLAINFNSPLRPHHQRHFVKRRHSYVILIDDFSHRCDHLNFDKMGWCNKLNYILLRTSSVRVGEIISEKMTSDFGRFSLKHFPW